MKCRWCHARGTNGPQRSVTHYKHKRYDLSEIEEKNLLKAIIKHFSMNVGGV
jgi:hypothetical protein